MTDVKVEGLLDYVIDIPDEEWVKAKDEKNVGDLVLAHLADPENNDAKLEIVFYEIVEKDLEEC